MMWYELSKTTIYQKLKPYHIFIQKVINFLYLHFQILSLKPQWAQFWSAEQLPIAKSLRYVIGWELKSTDILEKLINKAIPTFWPRRNYSSWEINLYLSSHEELAILSKCNMKRQIPCNQKKGGLDFVPLG